MWHDAHEIEMVVQCLSELTDRFHLVGDLSESARDYAMRHFGYPLTKAQWSFWHKQLTSSIMAPEAGDSWDSRVARLHEVVQQLEARQQEQQALQLPEDNDFHYDYSLEVRDTTKQSYNIDGLAAMGSVGL
jgi:hypothetical protein